MGLKERGAITGIGETAYSRNSGKSVVALQMEASLAAIADAGLAPTDIDGIIAYAPSGVVAEDFVTNFGIPDLRFSATTPMGGASAVAAVQCALAVVATGVGRHVLIPLGRNGASGRRIGARVREMPQFRVVGEFEMPVRSERGAPAAPAVRDLPEDPPLSAPGVRRVLLDEGGMDRGLRAGPRA